MMQMVLSCTQPYSRTKPSAAYFLPWTAKCNRTIPHSAQSQLGNFCQNKLPQYHITNEMKNLTHCYDTTALFHISRGSGKEKVEWKEDVLAHYQIRPVAYKTKVQSSVWPVQQRIAYRYLYNHCLKIIHTPVLVGDNLQLLLWSSVTQGSSKQIQHSIVLFKCFSEIVDEHMLSVCSFSRLNLSTQGSLYFVAQ